MQPVPRANRAQCDRACPVALCMAAHVGGARGPTCSTSASVYSARLPQLGNRIRSCVSSLCSPQRGAQELSCVHEELAVAHSGSQGQPPFALGQNCSGREPAVTAHGQRRLSRKGPESGPSRRYRRPRVRPGNLRCKLQGREIPPSPRAPTAVSQTHAHAAQDAATATGAFLDNRSGKSMSTTF